ncbi:DUF2777 domain-containing protein [Thermaerobacillus caldiproteolyticus]|uniref:DUF2777 domain-containing protein n=1 Tax=Thermaerobacillus caldiproteolyticus TaxID=247480 RepID=UPI0018F2311B|nr:DUF2777 domain-containing protein [Anoxybacillus caldiproteolyticus]
MNLEQRLTYINEQKRSYIHGMVEHVNNEWVFFDEEDEEAIPIEKMTESVIEIFRFDQWIRGQFQENGTVYVGRDPILLQHGEMVRFRKQLPYAYQQWLEALSDKTFFHFVEWLNDLDFSLYDCLYCYNGLLFEKHTGVNFIIYDNTEMISNVQHYYERGSLCKDRFEMTFHTGKRFVYAQIG